MYNTIKRLLPILCLGLFACDSGNVQDIPDLAARLHAAQEAMEIPPQISDHIADMTLDQACQIQKAFVGAKSEIGNLDINELGVTLHKDTTLMNSGRGADALGDQWEALYWLINRTVEQAYVIRPDHLLITGALGNAFPAEAGKYTADYGNLGKVDFYIQ